MADNPKKQCGKHRKKQHKDQLEQTLQQVDMGHKEKQSHHFTLAQRALGRAMQYIEKAIVNLTYLTSNEGENSSGISAIDEVDGKIAQEETEAEDKETEDDVRMKALFAKIQIAQEETEAEDKETEDDVRMKALFAKADEAIAQNTRMIKESQMLRAETEALLKRHDEMKAQASCDT